MTVRSGSDFPQAGLQLHAVHARHLDIQQRNIELRLLDHFQGFPGASGGPRRIPLAGKPLAQRIAHHQFIVDDQDSSLGSSCLLVVPLRLPFDPPVTFPFPSVPVRSLPGTRRRRRRCRQRHPELRPFARFAPDGDLTRVLLDNSRRHRQAQARAVLVFLGGKERVEDARQHVRRNARAGSPSRAPRPVRRPGRIP